MTFVLKNLTADRKVCNPATSNGTMTLTQKILDLNAFDARAAGNLDPATANLIARRRETFGPTSMLFYKKPLNLVKGEGVWLYDADGRRYLDCYNNVPSVGHCHPRVVDAVSQQMARLNTHTRYLYDIIYTYAERLLATFPNELSNVVFTCTGSESVDLALRIARHVTGGTGVIATANAYHGNTTTATWVSPSSASTDPKNEHVCFVAAPDTYRQPEGLAEKKFLEDIADALARMKHNGIRPAAMIADSILSSDGVYPGRKGFLNDVAKLVREAGALYIADEVQPGFARTGEAMWGFMRHGLVPDLVVLGKPMGNGYPIGGLIAKPEILQDFGSKNGYFNTFGGNPVAAAAGLAVLDVIRDEGLPDRVRDTGTYLVAKLKDLRARHEAIGDVRGAGLYLGLEFVTSKRSREPDRRRATAIMNALRDIGILGGTCGGHGNIWKIRPPLCFSNEHADALVSGLDQALTQTGE